MAKAVKKAAKPAKKISGKKPRPHWKKDWKNAGKAWDAGLDVRRAMFGPAGAENQIAETARTQLRMVLVGALNWRSQP